MTYPMQEGRVNDSRGSDGPVITDDVEYNCGWKVGAQRNTGLSDKFLEANSLVKRYANGLEVTSESFAMTGFPTATRAGYSVVGQRSGEGNGALLTDDRLGRLYTSN